MIVFSRVVGHECEQWLNGSSWGHSWYRALIPSLSDLPFYQGHAVFSFNILKMVPFLAIVAVEHL